MRLPFIAFEQPAGIFLLTVIPARDVVRIARTNPRKFDPITLETFGGVQREANKQRIKEIAQYSETADAAFPTPILLALQEASYSLEGDEINVHDDAFAEVVDGQHRIEGLWLS